MVKIDVRSEPLSPSLLGVLAVKASAIGPVECHLVPYLMISELFRLTSVSKAMQKKFAKNNFIWKFLAQRQCNVQLPMKIAGEENWRASVASVSMLGRTQPPLIKFGKMDVRPQVHALLPDGRIALAGQQGTVYILDPAEPNQPPQQLDDVRGRPLCMTRLGQKQLAVGFSGGRVGVWNTESAKCDHSTYYHTQDVTDVAGLSDGRLMTASIDSTVRIWNPNDSKISPVILKHEFPVQKIMPESAASVITVAGDNCVYRWDLLRSEKPQAQFRGHAHPILAAKFHGNQKLVTSSQDNTVQIWDLSRPTQPPQVLRHPAYTMSECQLLDEETLLTVGNDDRESKAFLWDLKQPKRPAKVASLQGRQVRILQDGRIAELGLFRQVRVCEINTRQSDAEMRVIDIRKSEADSIVLNDHHLVFLAPLPDGRHLMIDRDNEVMLHQPGAIPLKNTWMRRARQRSRCLAVVAVCIVVSVFAKYAIPWVGSYFSADPCSDCPDLPPLPGT